MAAAFMRVYPVFLDPIEFIVRRWHGVKFTVFECPNQIQMFVCLFVFHIFLSLPCLPLSLSLFLSCSQPRGRAGGRVCCFSAGGGDEMRRTVTRGACLSDIHPLTLPPTHWRSDTHAPCHINTYWLKKKRQTQTHTHCKMTTNPHKTKAEDFILKNKDSAQTQT